MPKSRFGLLSDERLNCHEVLKVEGYSLLRPPPEDHFAHPYYLRAIELKVIPRKNPVERTPEHTAFLKDRRKRHRSRKAEKERVKRAYSEVDLMTRAKATGKTVAQLIIEQWAD